MDIIDLIRVARTPLRELQPVLGTIPHIKPNMRNAIVILKLFYSARFERLIILFITPKLSKVNEII